MSLILIIRNVSALAPVSDYVYEVLVGDGTRERSNVLAQGTIHGHARSDGWQQLVKTLLDKETP